MMIEIMSSRNNMMNNSHRLLLFLFLLLMFLILNCVNCINNNDDYEKLLNNNNNKTNDNETKFIMKHHQQQSKMINIKIDHINDNNDDDGDDVNDEKSVSHNHSSVQKSMMESSTITRLSSSLSSSSNVEKFNDDDNEDDDDNVDVNGQDSNVMLKTTKSSTTTTTSTTTEKPTTTIINKKKKKSNINNQNSNNRTRIQSKTKKQKTKTKKRITTTTTTTTTTTVKPIIIDYDDFESNNTCLIGDICGHKQLGYCYRPHEPQYLDLIDDVDAENFYDLLLTSCPHFFDEEENLKHPLCCTVEMEDTMAKLIMSVDLIQRSCPSCLTNVKKLFCNLLCAPNQRDFIKINRLKGDTVAEVSYVLSELFAEKFYQSCFDVKVFGTYLMDFDSACGNLTRKHCTAKDFLEHLGSLKEIPFQFKPIIISDKESESTSNMKQQNKWPRYIMNETAYKCDEAPPGLSTCRCDHCANMCIYGQYNPHIKKIQQQQSQDLNNNIMLQQQQQQQQSNRIGRHTANKNYPRSYLSSNASYSLLMPKYYFLSSILLLFIIMTFILL